MSQQIILKTKVHQTSLAARRYPAYSAVWAASPLTTWNSESAFLRLKNAIDADLNTAGRICWKYSFIRLSSLLLALAGTNADVEEALFIWERSSSKCAPRIPCPRDPRGFPFFGAV